MADNKRFVSYMYDYKYDHRQENIGYARIEARNNQCKLFIHISLPKQNGKLFKAYMFNRKPTKHRFAYLGNILIQDNKGELKVKSDRNNVMNSDLSLDDLCGIIIYKDRESFIACEWDDEPITHILIDQIEDLELNHTNKSLQENEWEPMPVQEDHKEEIPTEGDYDVVNDQEQEVVAAQLTITPENETLIESENEEIASSSEEVLREQAIEVVDVCKENAVECAEPQDTIEDLCKDIRCIEPTCCNQQSQREEIRCNGRESGKFECHPIAQNIFHRFPKVYPFADQEITDCVRIEPQDIGLLPIEAWVLGNNSFLLHGYYTYRHLIFGKITTMDGFVYVIGVPGVYHSRESFMAKMFGFDHFKCVKKTEKKDGEFGYFYLPIQIG